MDGTCTPSVLEKVDQQCKMKLLVNFEFFQVESNTR